MNFVEMIKNRRSVYSLNKNMPVSDDEVFSLVRDCVKYVPDAFNMKSQRVVIFTGVKHKKFWDNVYDELVNFTDKNLSREQIDFFAAGYGTILYFYDIDVVEKTKTQYPLYADRFNDWVMQSNGMLQFAVWTGLRTLGLGSNLQHYNPVINKMVHNMFNIPENWVLIAQMPFGGIEKNPESKPDEDISKRFIIKK